ncbi:MULTISPECIES: M4 family metallopeptidase [Streptomyces]|uniref:M4 family metallopeptidase n=1 Tax=Streptomyces TaxID=1883 RepID=UPI002248BD3A|nr:M4 family metallopeptidase [Streptomyces sp. JHD 1]MCX2971421.1 M4 family metallopeptidase [Streptomyces sp. JHD 1]
MIGVVVALTVLLGGAAPGSASAASERAPREDPASAYVQRAEAERGGEEYVRVGVTAGANGISYHAYERDYRGLRVVGGDFVVVTDASGALLSTPLAGQEPLEVDVRARVSAQRAARVARARLDEVREAGKPEKVVFSPEGQQALAYEVVVEGRSAEGRPSTLHVVVDARTGGVLAEWDEVMAGSVDGYYYDDVSIDTRRTSSGYALSDPERSGMFCGIRGNGAVSGPDDRWGNGSGTDLETACAEAYWAAQQQWDMMRDWLGRDGFDGNGRGFPVFVGLNAVNAYWNGHTVNIGRTKDSRRQLSTLDIVAHEHGHAVFQYTPGGFDGYTETYALNEANGDIFGALTEHYANHPDDRPDYLFAEEADALGRGAERVMYDPSAGPRDEPNCWSPKIPETEVHDAAGPANHWFYLIAEGSEPGGGKPSSPICAGGPESVTGLGIENAGRIWMTALLQKTSFWEYADARVATMNAALQLHPEDCAVFDTVRGAWDAVSVPAQPGEPRRPAPCGEPEQGFSISLSPSSDGVDAGESVTATVSTSTTSGSPQRLSLAAGGLPSGADAALGPRSLTSGESATLTVTTAESTPAGTYPIAVTATGAEVTRRAVLELTVRATTPPDRCEDLENVGTGRLDPGGSAYQPDGSYFHTGASGTHEACLTAPEGADFDVHLLKWNGRAWEQVAAGDPDASPEQLSYAGTAGLYRYRVHAASGSGDYTLGYAIP